MNIITRLALENNKKNKSRSILIMLTVFFTTVLLSAIATFGYANIRYQKINAEKFYGRYHGSYHSVTEDQIIEMEKHSQFAELGKAGAAGEVQGESRLSLMWVSSQVQDLANLNDQIEQGEFPQKQNEIAAPKEFFEKLGYSDIQVGDEVALLFRSGKTEPFDEVRVVVSGILKSASYEQENQGYTGYVSEEFFNSCFAAGERRYSVYFVLSDELHLNMDNVEQTIFDLAGECGISPEQAVENTYYTMWALDPGLEMIAGCAMAGFIVIIISVIVIYNIFQVGIVQKIQEYGKMKAIGSTKKQMKQLVFREGMLLAVPAIPFGIGLGCILVKFFMCYWMIRSQDLMGVEGVSDFSMFSFWILFFCALVTLFTVWLALRRPIRLVSGISPVEAIRYQESARKGKGMRKGNRSLNVSRIMFANLAGNRKRTVLTIVTMGLSCVLFVVIANLTGNISPEYTARKMVPYGQFEIELSYDLNDEAYPENNLDMILQNNPLNAELVEQISLLGGVTEVKTMDFLYGFDEQGNMTSVQVMNREQFNTEVDQGSLSGTVDYDEASDQGAILYGASYWLEDTGYYEGDMVSMTLGDGRREVAFEGELQGSFGMTDASWVITEETYWKLGFEGKSIGSIWVDCDEKDCERIEGELRALLDGSGHYEISSYSGQLETAKMQMGMIDFLAYGAFFMVGIISFMNMANTIIISIITRRRELGVLQALGMTNRQMNRMLRNEGLMFTGGSMLVSLVVGMPVGYALWIYGRDHGSFGLDVYHVPFAELAGMFVIFAALQLTLSYLLSRNIKKQSVVERIRYEE